MAKRDATITERQTKWFKSVEEGIMVLASPKDVDKEVTLLLRAAYDEA